MSAAFPRWQDALDAATTDEARRDLLGEVARWRATHLIDVLGQRDATYAIAQLQRALGDEASALREARSLISLCRTPPEAGPADLEAADALVVSLGGKTTRKKRAPKADKPAREPRGRGEGSRTQSAREPRKEAARTSPLDQAVQLGQAGEYGEAFKALRGKGGPKANLIRTWLDLKQAVEGPADARDQALADLLTRLEGVVGGGSGSGKAAEKSAANAPSKAEPRAPESRVGKLVGRAMPNRRAKALRAMQDWLDGNPGGADALASAALQDHQDESGTAPAPWLAGFVGQALVDAGAETRATMESMIAAGSVAMQIYDEAPFPVLVDLWRAARDAGLRLVDLRRGILRSEPEDRRIWTLRLARGGEDALVAVAPPTDEALAEGLVPEFAKRLRSLSDRTVLIADGAGNAGLRAAAAALDIPVVSADEALARVLASLPAADAAPVGPAPAKKQEEAPKSEPKERTRNPSHAERVQAVREVLLAEAAPTAEALEPLVAPIKRVRDVLSLADELSGDDVAARLRALVTALHRTAPERVRLLQATTLILKTTADGDSLTDLLTSEETASRLGGPGAERVIAASQAARSAGFDIDRVLRGVTRRERREHGALDVLADHLDPLWRLVVQQGDVRGEIWVADELPVEGQAALPQLALRDSPRVAVTADGLADAWDAAAGPARVSVEALPEALGGWASGG